MRLLVVAAPGAVLEIQWRAAEISDGQRLAHQNPVCAARKPTRLAAQTMRFARTNTQHNTIGLTAPLGRLLPAISPLADPVHHRLVEEHVHRRQQHLPATPKSLEGRHHVPWTRRIPVRQVRVRKTPALTKSSTQPASCKRKRLLLGQTRLDATHDDTLFVALTP